MNRPEPAPPGFQRLTKVKPKNFSSTVMTCLSGGYEKYVEKHEKIGRTKIWQSQKEGLTLQSLSGTTVPQTEAQKDIEKLTIDKK